MSDVRKLLHPDFFVAGRKPTGDVEIDWSNPLARGLKVFVLLNDNGIKTKNYADDNGDYLHATENASATGYTRKIEGQEGRCLLSNRIDGPTLSLHDPIPSTVGLTVLTRVKYNEVAADHAVINIGEQVNVADTLLIWADTFSGALRAGMTVGSVAYGADGGIPINEWVTWGATLNGITPLAPIGKLYVNGSQSGATKTDNGEWNDGVTADSHYLNEFGGGRPTGGETSWIARWDRELSASEISEFTKNPYQILKPKTNYFHVPEVAAVGITGTSTTTNAADTQASTGELTNSGTSTTTNAADTQAASGALTNSGTAATTNVPDAQAAAGELTNSGTAATTNAADSQAAAGILTVVGTAATANADDTHAASGTVSAITAIIGTSATTNAPDIHSALGFVGVDITPPTTAGLEFEVGSNRLHFEASSNKLDYSVEYNRLHYEVTE